MFPVVDGSEQRLALLLLQLLAVGVHGGAHVDAHVRVHADVDCKAPC